MKKTDKIQILNLTVHAIGLIGFIIAATIDAVKMEFFTTGVIFSASIIYVITDLFIEE